MATRPSKLDIPGNFFQSSGLIANCSKKSQKPHDSAPKILYPGASEFGIFIHQNPFYEYLFILLLFSYQIFYQGRISFAPAANSKIWRYPLPLFIISIGTRSPSMEKENSQVKRCSFFKKIVANRALFRYFI